MFWLRGRLGLKTLLARCGCSKLISWTHIKKKKMMSWTSLVKLCPTKSIYNNNPLSPNIALNKQYQHLFPSFYEGYVSHRIEWFYSVDPPHPPRRDQVDEALKNVFDKDRMDFANLKQVHYDYDYDFEILTRFWEGHWCNVISLLSTHGDQLVRIGANNNNTITTTSSSSSSSVIEAGDLWGKHILICCVSIPLLWIHEHALHLRKLSLLASEMYSHTGLDFEIVIVADMRSPEWDDEGVFHHFLTAFKGCLAVPFHHKYRRQYICKSLRFEGNPISILVDPSLKVIKFCDLKHLVEHGARGFPFTSDHLGSLSSQGGWGGPCAHPPPCNTTLAGLLSCGSTFLLHKENNPRETISVEQLNNHHVGLYLFNQGDQLKQIHHIYQQCKDQGLDFELVFVPLSYGYSAHPKDFQHIVCNVLNKLQIIPDWWIIPFDNSLYLRLFNLSGGHGFACPGTDCMIIVGPHNDFVDKRAGRVIYHYGMQFGVQAYPFTREALLQAFLQRLENITLESFLTCDHVYQDYHCDDSKIVPVTQLRRKNVVVYMDIPLCLGPPWTRYDQVVHLYNKIKKFDPDFELVFVPSLFPVPESEFAKHYSEARECIFESKMKWLVCPFTDPKQLHLLQKNDAIKLMGDSSLPFSVLAFGKDGHIRSLNALDLLSRHGDDAYTFLHDHESRDEILRKEISPILHVY